MATTPQQFFQKNLKWITLGLLVLFLFKSVQSCNRNMGTTITEKEYKHTIDSLTKKADILERKLELCENEVRIKNEIISADKSQRERELEIRQKEAEKKIQINNNITLPDTTRKR